MKKMVFIYNPRAGKGKIADCFYDIIKAFSQKDYEITLMPTKHRNHCCEYIKDEGLRFDRVVVAGGDGTVNEAFNALMALGDKKVPLGYIPMGTTNDFASSCDIPQNPSDAAAVAVGDYVAKIDAGKFNDRYFCYVAAFGVLTDVAYDTPQEVKNLFGRAAYIVEGIKRLTNVKSYRMKVCCNDRIFEDDFIFGMVTNSHSVGGLKLKSLEVDLCDGLFEVLLFKKIQKVTDINAILTDLLQKKSDSEHYYIIKTDKITFDAEDAVAWTLDGEYGGENNLAVVENVNRAIKIAVAE